MLELASRQWHAPTVELFGLDVGMMPRVASNSEVLGRVKEGPLAGVPISGAAPRRAAREGGGWRAGARGCARCSAQNGGWARGRPGERTRRPQAPSNAPRAPRAPLPRTHCRCPQAAWATSRLRLWASAAAGARPRTLTAPAASCCSTRVRPGQTGLTGQTGQTAQTGQTGQTISTAGRGRPLAGSRKGIARGLQRAPQGSAMGKSGHAAARACGNSDAPARAALRRRVATPPQTFPPPAFRQRDRPLNPRAADHVWVPAWPQGAPPLRPGGLHRSSGPRHQLAQGQPAAHRCVEMGGAGCGQGASPGGRRHGRGANPESRLHHVAPMSIGHVAPIGNHGAVHSGPEKGCAAPSNAAFTHPAPVAMPPPAPARQTARTRAKHWRPACPTLAACTLCLRLRGCWRRTGLRTRAACCWA
jgi:hypothetical protein